MGKSSGVARNIAWGCSWTILAIKPYEYLTFVQLMLKLHSMLSIFDLGVQMPHYTHSGYATGQISHYLILLEHMLEPKPIAKQVQRPYTHDIQSYFHDMTGVVVSKQPLYIFSMFGIV